MNEMPAEIPESCMIQCAFCVHTFENAEQLQRHVLSMHSKPSVEQLSVAPAELAVEEMMGPSSELQLEQPIESKLFKIESGQVPINGVTDQTLLGQVEDTNSSFSHNELETCTNAVPDSFTNRKHSNSVDTNDSLMYKCHHCMKSFNLKIKLNRHLKMHSQ